MPTIGHRSESTGTASLDRSSPPLPPHSRRQPPLAESATATTPPIGTPRRSGLHTRNASLDASVLSRSISAMRTERACRNAALLSDLSNFDALALGYRNRRPVFALPNFSTVSLMMAWVLSVVGSVLCYVLAEVHQEDYLSGHFPLAYVASLACHLSVLGGFIVYIIGRQRYGAHVYRFYQPFSGGQRFVLLQFFGVFCLSVAFLSTAIYVQLLTRPEDARPGVFLAIAALTTLGSLFLYLSPRYFEPSGTASAMLAATGAGGEASSTATADYVFSLSKLLEVLKLSPNTETAIVCAIAAAQVLVSCIAWYVRRATYSSVMLVLIMQVCNGVLVHYFIGCRSRRGYRLVMLGLPRGADTVVHWIFWVVYTASLLGDRFCLRVSHSHEPTKLPTSFYYGVLGLNTYSIAGLLYFVRTTTFYKRASMPPASLLEIGGVAVVIASLLLGAFNVFSVVYTQMYNAATDGGNSSAQRDTARAVHVGYYLGQAFALMLPPMVQVVGKSLHGAAFSMLHSYRGYPSFLFAQGYGWLSYVLATFCTALFVLTGSEVAGSAAAVLAALSTLSVTSSLREYSSVKWQLLQQAQTATEAARDRATEAIHWDAMASSTPPPELAEATPKRTLADVVRSAAAVAASSPTARAASPDEGEEPLEASSAGLMYVLNGEMIAAYILAFSNIMVRATADLYSRQKIAHGHVAVIDLSAVAYTMFILSVPLAHLSGRDKGIHILPPFTGSSTYVALQVLGWFTYAAAVVSILISGILTLKSAHVPAEMRRGLKKVSYSNTMAGLLQLIPLILITVSIAHESVAVAARRRRRSLAKEAFITIRDVLRVNLISAASNEERAVMQLAFSMLMVPALEHYELAFGRKAMQLYRPRASGSSGAEEATVEDAVTGEFDPALQQGESSAGFDGVADGDNGDTSDDNDGSQEEIVDSIAVRRRTQEGARVIAILMSCTTATLFIAAAFFSNVAIFSLACAVCGLLLCTVDCIGMHVGYGVILHGRSGSYSIFTPFTGGGAFVYRQILGWTCYAGTFLITLIAGLEDQGVSAGAMVAAAALSVISQISILASVPYFTVDKRDRRSFLEENGEGIIAVLAFTGALAFAHTYQRVRDFFYGDAAVTDGNGSIAYPGGGLSATSFDALMPNVSRRNRVPFVLALLSIVVAIPFVLIALARTTRQWERIARKARRDLRHQRVMRWSSALGSARGGMDVAAVSQEASAVTTPRCHHSRTSGRRHGDCDDEVLAGGEQQQQRQRIRHGVLAVALTNLLEVGTILFCTVAPLTALFLVYYVVYNVSPRTLEAVTSYLPVVLLVAVGTVLLSIIPYLASRGIWQSLYVVRIYVITYGLYGMPILAASVLIGPALLYPCLGTQCLAIITFVITIAGNYKQVRRCVKFGVYGLFGYSTYCLGLAYQAHYDHGGHLVSWPVARLALDYAVDGVFLFFWIWYLPLFHGRPELSGAQRSLRFTHFVRHYIWEEAARFFNFRIVIDDPTVHMREGVNKYLFSFHPHGVFPGTALFAPNTMEWERKVGLNTSSYVSTHAAGIIFNVPLIRDFNLRQGALSVSRRGLEASLARGNSVLIVTGGQAEMLHTKISDTTLTLVTQHKGFIRIAIRNRVPMVPLLCFGEQNVLGLVQFPQIQRVMIKILGFPFPMFPYGGFMLPLPRRTRLSLVIGKPIEIPEGADPDDDELINKLSKVYFDELKGVFYRNRVKAGYPNLELILVDDHAEAQKSKVAAFEAKAEKKAAKEVTKETTPM